MQSLQLLVIVLTLSIRVHNSLAGRNFNLLFRDIKCSVNPDYFSHVSCSIANTTSVPSINVDAQMIKEIKKVRLDFSVDLERPKGDSITLFRATNIDGCDLLIANVTQLYLKMYKEFISKAGDLPEKCPIAADFHFRYTNLTLDENYLPKFVPEASFKINLNLKERKTSCWRVTVLGSVVNKRQKKRLNNF